MTAPNTPTQVEVLSRILDQHGADLMVCLPGVVEQFSRTAQIARVRPVTLKSDGTRRPVTVSTPVVFPGVYWDVQVGEAGLLVIADEDWATWWRTGEDSRPESEGSHQLAFSFFIPGLRSEPNARTIPTSTSVHEKPAAGGEVHLGDVTASKAALHEDLLGGLDTFLTLFETWGLAIDVAVFGVPGGTLNWLDLKAQSDVIQAGIAAGSYQSPSVMVED